MATRIEQSPGCVDLLIDSHVRSGHGERIALVEHGQLGRRTLTYKQVQDITIELAADLSISVAGKMSQCRIALVGGSTLETVCYWLAAMRSGHLPFLVHPDLSADQYPILWEGYDPTLILYDRLATSPDGLPCQNVDEVLLNLHSRENQVPEVGAQAGAQDQRPALILATSGSTGRPKLCVHPHRSFWEFERTVTRTMWGLTRDDKVLGSSGPYFSFGLQGIHVPLSVGATAVLLPEWKIHTDFLDTIESEGVTTFLGVPTLFHLLMSRAKRHYDLSSLTLSLSAGERLPEVIRSRWEQYSGSQMLDSIGTTETFAPYLSELRGKNDALCTVGGFEYAETEVNIDNSSGQQESESTPTVTLGLAKGCMMLGYFSEKGELQTSDKPFVTKDLFVRVENGYRFMSRDSERIKVGGQWVSPQELEEYLLEDERIECAAAVPITTAEGLVRLRAYIVLCADYSNVGEQVLAALTQRIQAELKPKALRPDRIEIVEKIAGTPTGKLKRQDLQMLISAGSRG